MHKILVITPFQYALENKVADIKLQLLCENVENYDICAIKALPDEVSSVLHGKSFDIAYADRNYIPEELAEIRSHIMGDSYKNLKIF